MKLAGFLIGVTTPDLATDLLATLAAGGWHLVNAETLAFGARTTGGSLIVRNGLGRERPWFGRGPR